MSTNDDRAALLDLQARWAAAGLAAEMEGDLAPYLVIDVDFPRTWVFSRSRWQVKTITPAALRVFVEWLEDGA